MLELERLGLTRPGFSLQLDLALPAGEYGVLLGPSGCGKSTALRIVAGLLAQDSGQVRLGGRLLDGLPPERRRVGMVFQDYALFPQLSVRRNIEYGPALAGEPKADR
ncbi:MAG: ABC transporter ATP-binding protein, partial [Spirochaetaceae bacterium]|nr:ABC transporter ATP-binding protein [Spirochaetaceae bacterium]